MRMGSISLEALIAILALIIIIMIFYSALHNILSNVNSTLAYQILNDRAVSTSLLVSIYSYSLNHGFFNASIDCSVGLQIVCKNANNNIAAAKTYRRKGGGD